MLLRWAGDDPEREGLRGTPGRVARAFEEYFTGYETIRSICCSAPSRRPTAMTRWWC